MKRKTIPEQHLFYHNTLKLLQNYRDVNWSLEVSAQNLQSEFRAEYSGASAEYVDDLTITGDKNAAARIEGLTLSLDKSRRMMQLVDSAIALMRQKHKKGELYYWILYYTYLCPQEPDTINEVLIQLEKHFQPMSIRTYYSRREEAVDSVAGSARGGCANPQCGHTLSCSAHRWFAGDTFLPHRTSVTSSTHRANSPF